MGQGAPRRKALLPGLVLLVLAGCTPHSLPSAQELVDPAISQRITLPPQFEQRLERLVKEPNRDEKAVSAPDQEVFSLPQAVAYAQENNPRLRAAVAAILRAQGREEVAFAPFLPEVDMMNRFVVAAPNIGPGAPGILGVVLPTGDGVRNFGQTELQVHWTLCDFGRTAGRFAQAVSQEKIVQLRLLRARQTVAFDVLVAYLQVLHAQALAQVQEQYLRSARAFLADARSRHQAGTAERNDVLRADVQTSEAQESGVLARQQELEALAGLNHAMGRNAGLPIQVVSWSAEPGFRLSLSECLEMAAAQRQEIGMAQAAVAAALHGRDAAQAEYCPKVYVLVGAGDIGGTLVMDGLYWGTGIHVDQKLYSGGRRRGQVHEADADVEEAIANAQTIFDGISLEVNLAYRSITAARQRIELTRTQVTQARENLRLMQVRYRNGTATPTDVADATTTAVRAEQRDFLALYDYLQALGRLEYTMGLHQGSLLGTPGKPGASEEQLPMPRQEPVEPKKP